MATIHYDEPKNWIELFKQGRLHVVCVASGGLTTCDFLASTVGNMHQQEVWRLTKHVNREGETGTFWPRYPLTVLPQFEWEGRSALDDLERFLRKSFADVAEANRLHVKLPDVLLDLNPYCGNYDIVTALPIAREILSKEKSISNLWVMPTLSVWRETSVIGRSRQESIEPQMVILPRGQFLMGSSQGEVGRDINGVSNPLLDIIREASNRKWCMQPYCTACGSLDYRNKLKEFSGPLGGPQADALVDIDINELTHIPDWQGGLLIAIIDLPMRSMQVDGILRAWLAKAIGNIQFADFVLFKIARILPKHSDTRRDWINTCMAMAIDSKDFSLVESLILVLGQDAKNHAELMSIAADHAKTSAQMRRVLLNAFNVNVRMV